MVQSSESIYDPLCMNTSACKVHGNQAEGLTHNKVDVLSVCMSLEFERELVEIPDANLGLIRLSRNCMVPVSCSLDFVASFRKIKVLYQLNGALHLFPDDPLALAFGGSLLGKPIREGRGGRRS